VTYPCYQATANAKRRPNIVTSDLAFRKTFMPALFKRCVGLALLARLCLATPAMAGHANAQLTVSATVPTSVSVTVGSAGVGGGAVDLGTGTSGAVPLTINSSSTTPVAVLIGQGISPASGSTDAAPLRRMAANGFYLNYQLYQNAGHTIPWGNAAGTGATITSAGQTSLQVYAYVLPGQNVPVGTYTDTVVVTVSY
jgi:spore coat protein U-like protein